MIETENPPLSDLQRWMRWVLTHPGGINKAIGERAMTSLPKNWTRGRRPGSLLDVIEETSDVSKSKRLGIYSYAYFARLIDCLGANFSSVKNVIGEDKFSSLAKAYLVKYPSRFKCIDDIGKTMPEFIATRSLKKEFPFLSDLAAIDWAYHESFYADEPVPTKSMGLTALTREELAAANIPLAPSVRLLSLNWPVVDLWRADGKGPRAKWKRMRRMKTRVLLFRRANHAVRAIEMDANEFQLLRDLHSGASLGKALTRRKSLQPTNVTRCFRQWVSMGLLRTS